MKTDSAARARASFLLRLVLIPILLVATAAHAAGEPAAGGASTAGDKAAEVDPMPGR